jgi:predicted PurR-regulated permease PerM/methylmalonyl-CoA mutase cobalamin-binding subunit
MARNRSDIATISSVAQLLAIILIVAALYFAKDVFIPLTLGLLLSFLLSPVVNRLERWGVPNVVAVVSTALLSFVLLAAGFTMLGRELATLVGDLPKYKHELVTKARSVAEMTTGVGGSLEDLSSEVTEALENGAATQEKPIKEETGWASWVKRLGTESEDSSKPQNDGSSVLAPLYVKQVKENVAIASWASTVGTVLGPLATAGLVSVFALFMLIYREDLRDRIIAVVSQGNYVTTTEALNEAASKISKYLLAQTIINASYGFILAIGLAVIGATMTEDGVFPNAILWGVLAACLRFVPYAGPTIAAIFPLAVAMSVFPGYTVALTVLGFIVTLELVSNNVMEPWIYGSSTGISAVAVIIAAVFWGWLWGPVGLLLSTPLTVCLVVLGRYAPRFKVLSTLLGEELQIQPSVRFYQRMLAGDDYRAGELLLQRVNETSLASAIDEVIVPAIKRIRRDQQANRLSYTDANRLLAVSGGLISKLDETEVQADVAATETGTSGIQEQRMPVVVGCAAHDISESLILNVLRIGGKGKFELNTLEHNALPEDVALQIVETSPNAVVIVVLPKGGLVESRYLCSAIRGEGYRGPILVCCLGKFTNFDQVFTQLRKAGATTVTTTYSHTQSRIESLLQRPNLPKRVRQKTPA